MGTVFTQSTLDTTLLGVGTARYTVLDTDNVRGNASALGEELVMVGEPAPAYNSRIGAGVEALATVNLRNGATVTVRGLHVDLGFDLA